MEYVLETDVRGKQVPRKIGLQPVMRDQIEYEFGVVFDIGSDHCATCSKDRTNLFIDQHFQITEATGTQLLDWLNSAPEPKPEPTIQEQLATEMSDIDSEVLSAFLIEKKMSADGSILAVSDDYAQKAMLMLPRLRDSINKFRRQANMIEPATQIQS
jgi:hypothetical protein